MTKRTQRGSLLQQPPCDAAHGQEEHDRCGKARVDLTAHDARERVDKRVEERGDQMYHSGRKKKEFASPYLEFLDTLEKAARRMPQPYEFDLGHADGIRHADLDAGERVLNEMIHECQRSLEGIGHARLDLDARSWARGMGLRE